MATISFNDTSAGPEAEYTVYQFNLPIPERSEIHTYQKRSKSLPIPARVSLSSGTVRTKSSSSDNVAIDIETEGRNDIDQVLRPVVMNSTEARFYEGYSASPSDENGPVEIISTIGTFDTTMTEDFCYTDSTEASKEPPSIVMWVGLAVMLALIALVLTGGQIIGWGARMGRTVDTRPLIAPLGDDLVLSRVLAALSSLSAVLIWAMVIAVCASSHTSIERAARRPILPVFLEAVRNRQKLSKATVRCGWRVVSLRAGTALGAGAGTALIATAAVPPATLAQRVLFLVAVMLLDACSILHMLAVGTVRFRSHKAATLTQLAGVVITLSGIFACVYEFGGMWYYAVPHAIFVVLSGLSLVFLSVAWQNRYERVELRGIW